MLLTNYRLEVLRTPHLGLQISGASPACYLYFWLAGYNIRGSHNPFSALIINWLEWLTENSEKHFTYWFIIKGITQEQPDGRDGYTVRCGERARNLGSLSKHATLPKLPCVHQCRLSLNAIYGGFITKADWLNHCRVVTHSASCQLSSLEVREVKLKVTTH